MISLIDFMPWPCEFLPYYFVIWIASFFLLSIGYILLNGYNVVILIVNIINNNIIS